MYKYTFNNCDLSHEWLSVIVIQKLDKFGVFWLILKPIFLMQFSLVQKYETFFYILINFFIHYIIICFFHSFF